MFSTARLIAAREAKGWRQSDLARAIWGQIISSESKLVARNRDRISVWEMGRNKPNRENLRLLADALGVAPDDLLDAAPEPRGPAPHHEWLITQASKEPGKARLQVDMEVPFMLAAEIGEKLAASRGLTKY